MGHTKPQDLKDVSRLIGQIRQLEKLKEKSPNVFYYGSKPFLHFHDKDGKRWADVLDGSTWGAPIDLPFAPTAKQKSSFFTEVLRRHKKACLLTK